MTGGIGDSSQRQNALACLLRSERSPSRMFCIVVGNQCDPAQNGTCVVA